MTNQSGPLDLDLFWRLTPNFQSSGSSGAAESRSTRLSMFADEDGFFAHEGVREPVAASYVLELPKLSLPRRSQSSRWRDVPVPAEIANVVGSQLRQALPSNVYAGLANTHAALLKLSSPVDSISDLPWEWLLAPTVGPVLGRSIPKRLPLPPRVVRGRIRVLLVVSNPKDESLLDPHRELSVLAPPLQKAPFDLQICNFATVDALEGALKTHRPHVVHYVGHAGETSGQGSIILHNVDGGTDWVSASQLAQLLPPTVQLLCLSTCISQRNYNVLGLPRVALTSDINLPTTIANQYAISEYGAGAFWKVFYEVFVQSDGDVAAATREARRACAAAVPANADWASFLLAVRDNTAHALAFDAGLDSAPAPPADAEELRARFEAILANELDRESATLPGEAGRQLREISVETTSGARALYARLPGGQKGER